MMVRQSQVKVLNLRILLLIETFQLPEITWVFSVSMDYDLQWKFAFVNMVAYDKNGPIQAFRCWDLSSNNSERIYGC